MLPSSGLPPAEVVCQPWQLTGPRQRARPRQRAHGRRTVAILHDSARLGRYLGVYRRTAPRPGRAGRDRTPRAPPVARPCHAIRPDLRVPRHRCGARDGDRVPRRGRRSVGAELVVTTSPYDRRNLAAVAASGARSRSGTCSSSSRKLARDHPVGGRCRRWRHPREARARDPGRHGRRRRDASTAGPGPPAQSLGPEIVAAIDATLAGASCRAGPGRGAGPGRAGLRRRGHGRSLFSPNTPGLLGDGLPTRVSRRWGSR